MKTHLIYKALYRLLAILKRQFDTLRCHVTFWGNNVSYKNFHSNGVPLISVARGGFCKMGENFTMINGAHGNPIGCFQPCTFFVDKGAKLTIGDHVGISQTAIICHNNIFIGNNVKIGGGVCIYDTDFHALDYRYRAIQSTDFAHKVNKPVTVEMNVFIGAHSLILKGVTIGENSIVGAGSVVTKSIPANQIWAGNPAKFIRNL